MLICIFTKHKKWIHNWWSNLIGDFIHFYHECLKVSLVSRELIIFINIWKLLLCWLLINLKTFSCTSSIKLFDCLEFCSSRLEGNNSIEIWSLRKIWVSFYFYQGDIKSAHNFWSVFFHRFLICLFNINFWSIVIPRIVSPSLSFKVNSFRLRISLSVLFLFIHLYS